MTVLVPLAIGVLGFATAPFCSAAVDPAPTTMRAAAFDKAGGPEEFSIHELPIPSPSATEVLIAVHGAGVAVWEADMRQHMSNHAPFPIVLGSDGAGTVVAVGSEVRGFKVGDEVYGSVIGFYAEYVKLRAERIAPVPKGFDRTQASVLAISGLSALQGIDDVLQLKAGQTLLRPGDQVRQLVPNSGPAKLLIIWAPAGEAERVLRNAKGTVVDPVTEVK